MAIQQKGSDFERSICVKMSEWVSAGQRKDIFWRTAMSGGRATVFKKRGSLYRQSGDLCSVAPEGHAVTDKYFFELKCYKDVQFESFFIKKKGILTDFWNKAKIEAYDYGLVPILIVKQNLMPILLIAWPNSLPQHWLRHTGSFRIDIRHQKCSVFRFDDIMSSKYAAPGSAPTRVRL